MPTPLGHALAGLAVAGIVRGPRLPPRQVAVLAFCAAAPDLDLVLRLVDGANHHRGPSHSFAAAILVALATLLLRRVGLGLPGSVLMGAAWASHVVLDYLGLDTSPPIGEMALWPFSEAFYASPVPVFYDIPRSFSPAAIRHNLVAVTLELLILVPVAWLCWGGFKSRPGSGPEGRG
jgi:inner membrane protein